MPSCCPCESCLAPSPDTPHVCVQIQQRAERVCAILCPGVRCAVCGVVPGLAPVLWSIFFIRSGPQISGDMGGYGRYCGRYSGIQRDTGDTQRDTAGYSNWILKNYTPEHGSSPALLAGAGRGAEGGPRESKLESGGRLRRLGHNTQGGRVGLRTLGHALSKT
jgi:hypothetical protein